MPQTSSPVCIIKYLNVSVAPKSVPRISRCSPYLIRTITTTRSLQAAQNADDRHTLDRTDTESRDVGGLSLRSADPYAHRKEEDGPRLKKPVNLRCAELLWQDKHMAGSSPSTVLSTQPVTVRGVIKTIRKQKKGTFADVTDGSCFQHIQVVLDPELAEPLKIGTTLQVTGFWRESPANKQPHELRATAVEIFGTTDTEASKYPIQKKYHTPEFLRTIPHLRIRTSFNSVLARFRSSCLSYLSTYFADMAISGGTFIQVQPPIITSSDCEGAGQVFTVVPSVEAPSEAENRDALTKSASYFRAPRYLTVSSQLHLEAYVAELQNVWTLSPTFRAEKSDTPRHLAEFYMLEVEMSFTTSMGQITAEVEKLMRALTGHLITRPIFRELQAANLLLDASGEDRVEEIKERWSVFSGATWIRASYSHCMKRLLEAAEAEPTLFKRRPEFQSGLQLEHERWIVTNIGENRPIFVTDYPQAIKPFYMAPSHLATDHPTHQPPEKAPEHHPTPSEPGQDTVACFDLLFPFGTSEVAGGSLREHRLQPLIQNMRAHGLLQPKPSPPTSSSSSLPQPAPPPSHSPTPPAPKREPAGTYPHLRPGESLGSWTWYADLRRFGTVPHAGFGIGLDRLIGYLAAVHNLRDVVAFPRTFGRADS